MLKGTLRPALIAILVTGAPIENQSTMRALPVLLLKPRLIEAASEHARERRLFAQTPDTLELKFSSAKKNKSGMMKI